jgi:hypothetical protein
MAGNQEGAGQMKRQKRYTIKLVALGLAVAAIGAPAVQARPDGMTGSEVRSLHDSVVTATVGPDDRAIHGTSPQVVVSPDDRVIHGTQSPTSSPQPVSAEDGSGFDPSTGVLSGIVLLLAAGGMTAFSVYYTRKGRLASA